MKWRKRLKKFTIGVFTALPVVLDDKTIGIMTPKGRKIASVSATDNMFDKANCTESINGEFLKDNLNNFDISWNN